MSKKQSKSNINEKPQRIESLLLLIFHFPDVCQENLRKRVASTNRRPPGMDFIAILQIA
jgi:hypothetical protein